MIRSYKKKRFQEARGTCGENSGNFYIENIRELLDSPGEYFLDFANSNGGKKDLKTTITTQLIYLKK